MERNASSRPMTRDPKTVDDRTPRDSPPDPSGDLPDWIRRIEAAVWVCDAEQRLLYLNEHAERLLGGRRGPGRRCFECFLGKDTYGGAICSETCEVRRRAEAGLALSPSLWRQVAGKECWLILVPIPLRAPEDGGTWIVHVAQELGSLARIRDYLERIAHREPDASPPRERLARLSAREREILSLLAADRHPKAIARGLFVSVATVRNHVQHALAKLGVHSAQEAVALFLLYGGTVEGGGGGSRSSSPGSPAG